MTKKWEETDKLICQILRFRAEQRGIGIGKHRRVRATNIVGGDFKFNRHEIVIDRRFATSGKDPFGPADKILDELESLYRVEAERKVRTVVHVKSEMMKWNAYLHRTLTKEEYARFMRGLMNGAFDDEDSTEQV